MSKKRLFGNDRSGNEMTPWERYQLQNGNHKNRKKLSFIHDKKPKVTKQPHHFYSRTRNDQVWFLSILGVLIVAVGLTGYFAAPISRIDQVLVNGNVDLNNELLFRKANINPGSTIFNVYGKDQQIISRIKQQYQQIKTVDLKVARFNRIKINLKEYPVEGYLQVTNGYQPILSNGVILKQKSDDRDHDLPLLQGFNNQQKLSLMLEQYKNLSNNIQRMISLIEFSPTDINPERVYLKMRDKNQVYASISTFSKKMQYYPAISSKNKEPQIINFELGAYSYPVSQVIAQKNLKKRQEALQQQRRKNLLKRNQQINKKIKELQKEQHRQQKSDDN